jgi:hypothetical protein
MARNQNSLNQIITCGILWDDAVALRRISLALRRWYEHECNGAIQRDGDRGDGVPYWHSTHDGRKLYRAPDRERGALRRMADIMARYPGLTAYVQGDPRGCALYILRPSDVPESKDADAYYNRGIPVY